MTCSGENVTYSVIIRPKQAGKFKPTLSQVTYIPELDGDEQLGVSTEINEITVMTGGEARLKLALYLVSECACCSTSQTMVVLRGKVRSDMFIKRRYFGLSG